MTNLYLKWANQAMSDGWEVVTFARHKDHVPIVRGQLGSLRSMISAIISGELQEGVDYEWAEEEQVSSLFFFQFILQIVIFQVPEEFRDDCPDDHTLECSYIDTSERVPNSLLEDSLSWLSWDEDKVASLILFVCCLFFWLRARLFVISLAQLVDAPLLAQSRLF